MPRTDSAVAADWLSRLWQSRLLWFVNGLGVLDEFGIGFHHGGDLASAPTRAGRLFSMSVRVVD